MLDLRLLVPFSHPDNQIEKRILFEGSGFLFGHGSALVFERLFAGLGQLAIIGRVPDRQVSFGLYMGFDQARNFF